jgi:threonine dehydrogenase-like Zn-dependent dehydrogenase
MKRLRHSDPGNRDCRLNAIPFDAICSRVAVHSFRAAVALGAWKSGQEQAMKRIDVVVIGLGIIGSAAGCQLSRSGAVVPGIEAGSPAHAGT